MLPQNLDRSQRLQRRHVAAAGHDHIGVASLVVAGPFPDPQPGSAVLDRRIHVQPLQFRLLAGDDDIDIIVAAQAMVGHPQQGVGIGRQIDADDLGLLVCHHVDEPRVLMAEAIVVLSPHVRRQQIVQRGNRPAPRNVARHVEPLGMLVEHRVDNVDEGFVA